MLNEQINETSAHAIITQIASYYDAVDNAVKTGDTNKRYSVTTNACTSPSAPIANKSFTNLVISPTADNHADLYNSFIYAKIEFDVKNAVAHDATTVTAGGSATSCANYPSVWVGYKDAAQAIGQYQILANGATIYNQTNAIEEFYITSCADIDSVKKTDVFSRARHKDIWQKVDTVRTGAIIPLSGKAAGASTHVAFGIKIDVRKFLPLSTVKYLPAFVGNLSLRVQFNEEALVCAPLTLEDVVGSPIRLGKCATEYAITNRFVPIGQPFKCINKVDVAASVPTPTFIDNQIITVSNFTVQDCTSIVPCFGLDDYIYQQLVQRYSSEALSFPVMTLNVQQMNVTLGGKLSATLTTTPRFVDTIFMLFSKGSYDRTCHLNPLFKDWQIKMGGYGSFPDVSVSSYGAQFYEIMCNSYNVNTDVACFNDDVMKSLTQIAYDPTEVVPPGSEPTLSAIPPIGYKSNDVTNFVLAIPCSTDGTYQQGQTSNTPITYQFNASFPSTSPYYSSCVAQMCSLRDSVFAIQVKPGGTPVVVVDEADITSPQ